MIENGDKCYVTAKQSHIGDWYPLKIAIKNDTDQNTL